MYMYVYVYHLVRIPLQHLYTCTCISVLSSYRVIIRGVFPS